jgi:hypothetical protein
MRLPREEGRAVYKPWQRGTSKDLKMIRIPGVMCLHYDTSMHVDRKRDRQM